MTITVLAEDVAAAQIAHDELGSLVGYHCPVWQALRRAGVSVAHVGATEIRIDDEHWIRMPPDVAPIISLFADAWHQAIGRTFEWPPLARL